MVSVLIPYVIFDIREVIDLGFKPNIQAPRITETYGLRGTSTLIAYSEALKDFFISALRKGLSLNPPTIKMKLTGLPFFIACSASWATFDFMLSNRG